MSRRRSALLLLALAGLAALAQQSPTSALPGPLPLPVEASPGFSLTLERAWQAHSLKGEAFSYVSFSPDGRTLATSSSDGSARLWSISGEMRQRVENGNMVFRVRFDRSGERFITAVYDGIARVWDARDGALVRRYTGHHSGVTDAAFLDHAVATGSDDGRVLITAFDGRRLATVKQQGVARNLAVSPDRRLLACVFDSGEVRVVDAAGRPRHAFSTGQGRINDVRFSPDGTMLLTSGFDGTVRLWTLSGEQRLRIDAGDGDWVYSAGFSRDGGLIGTVSGTGSVAVWTSGGKLLAQYRSSRGRVNSIDFSPREDRFAVIDYTGAVLMFTYRRTP
jgi:centriolar protein POC1